VLPAGGGCGGGATDAASFFTPIRTRRKVKV
jgi:4-diphosphocytidyl-2C-methyl-D-erythritol kinase